jgi:cytochrome P450
MASSVPKSFEEIPEIRAKPRGKDFDPFDPLEPTLAIHKAIDGPIYRFRIKAADGDVTSVWLNDEAEAKRILVEEETRWRKGPQTFEPFSSLVPWHLITIEGDFHAHMRRRAQTALGDALSSGRIRGDIMGQKLIKAIRRAIDDPATASWMGTRAMLSGSPVLVVPSVDRLLRACALDIVVHALFGSSWGVIDDYTATNKRASALAGVMHELHWRVADLTAREWRRDRRANGAGELLDVLDAFIMDEIYKSRESPKRDEPERMLDEWAWDSSLSTEEVRNLALTFLTMGSENVSTALSWCVIQLSEHPEAQRNARRSFDTLRSCFDETVRLYPSVPVLTRQCPEETVICGHTIPRATEVVINLYALHRNTRTYGENACDFDFKRCPVVSTMGPPDAIPFGAGSRACVGRPLTNHELKTVLWPLLQVFEFVPVRTSSNGAVEMDTEAKTKPNNFVSYRPGPHLVAFRPLDGPSRL